MVNNDLWPDGRRFAFSVFDDTDASNLENVGPVYALLKDLGFRTTKSCWALRGLPDQGQFPGETLEDERYRAWLLELQSQGFEIGWHGATWHSSKRKQTLEGIDRFVAIFGHTPSIAVNHTGCVEAMYWGSHRMSGWRRGAYNLLTRFRNSDISRGQCEGDDHFWGDVCRQKIKYFRNFVFRDINTLKACPFMPYHDSQRPFVNHWFASSDGNDAKSFTRCLSDKNVDRLEAEGGACIMYTHFAKDFFRGGILHPQFRRIMTRLAAKNGWFVPVATLLDRLEEVHGPCEISDIQRRRLEQRWLWDKLFVGTT